jgi:TrmH family RNA methyltransferase
VQPITSFRNPKVKYLRSLRLRKNRQREGCFLVEGIRIVEEAITCGAPLETLIYAPELLVSARAKSLLEQTDLDQHLALSGDVFRTLSDRDQPQGIAAVVRVEDRPLTDIDTSPCRGKGPLLAVVAYQLRDPGNLGSIIRTADAAGATGVIVVEPSVDLYAPETVRATMGSLFALPVVRLTEEDKLASWFTEIRTKGTPLLVVASSAKARQLYFNVKYCQPLVLLVGSERHGLPPPVRDMADVEVRLPLAGRATSLNASAAMAALIYEIVRQRQICSLSSEPKGQDERPDPKQATLGG